jgi:hypothetical protein
MSLPSTSLAENRLTILFETPNACVPALFRAIFHFGFDYEDHKGVLTIGRGPRQNYTPVG